MSAPPTAATGARPDYYALLGVAADVRPEELRRAYGERARAAMDDQPLFEQVQSAWETLKDPEKRAAYDRERAGATAQRTRMTSNESTQMPGGTPGGGATVAMPAAAAGGSTLMGGRTVAATPTQMGFGGERTQAVSLAPCPICQTPGVPGEEFCVECGFLVGSVAGDEAAVRALPRLIDAAGREFPLKLGENTVGREGADVMLPDRTVSRRHARIVVEETGVVWTEDLGSTNGSRVGGAPLPAGRQTSLVDRAHVQFGSVKLTVLLPEGFARELLALPPPTAPAADVVAALPAPGAPAGTPAAPAAPAETAAARLIGKDGKTIALAAERTTLGRRPGNSIIIGDDAFVSGSHAEIAYERGRFLLADLGSTNGTKLNGTRLLPNVPNPLNDGDTVTVGQTEFTFRAAATGGGGG